MDAGSAQGRPPSPGDVTQLLLQLRAGTDGVWDELAPLVYETLREIAHRHVRREHGPQRPRTTVLVHEAYLKLVDQTRVQWEDRAHFYAVAAGCMRRILINDAHHRKAKKRGGGRAPVSLDEVQVGERPLEGAEELIDLDEALQDLEALSDRQARVVECRFFGGLTYEETAAALSVSEATVNRDWRVARAWLFDRLSVEEER